MKILSIDTLPEIPSKTYGQSHHSPVVVAISIDREFNHLFLNSVLDWIIAVSKRPTKPKDTGYEMVNTLCINLSHRAYRAHLFQGTVLCEKPFEPEQQILVGRRALLGHGIAFGRPNARRNVPSHRPKVRTYASGPQFIF